MSSLSQQAQEYHHQLPGLLRATLLDFGVNDHVVDRHEVGWDGQAITVPLRSRSGSTVFLERWEPKAIGVPIDQVPSVELLGWQTLDKSPSQVVIAEGIHEALVLESNGLDAVAASGSGRFFKTREWSRAFELTPEILVSFKAGDRRERKLHLKSRREIVERIRAALPRAEEVVWPNELQQDHGVFAFFKTLNQTTEDFLALPRQ